MKCICRSESISIASKATITSKSGKTNSLKPPYPEQNMRLGYPKIRNASILEHDTHSQNSKQESNGKEAKPLRSNMKRAGGAQKLGVFTNFCEVLNVNSVSAGFN